MSEFLTADQIIAAEDIKTKEVDLTEEWGGKVLISTMSAERHLIFEDMAAGKDKNDALASYAVQVLVNPDGSAMFTDVESVKKLSKKSSSALMKILSAGLELNKISEKDIEDIAKNS